MLLCHIFFFSSRRRHTRCYRDWSSDVCSSDLNYRRGHALWRVTRKGNGANRAWFNFDMNWLNQDPASPRVRDGRTLTPLRSEERRVGKECSSRLLGTVYKKAQR